MKVRRAIESDIDSIWEIYKTTRLDQDKLGDNQYEAEIQRKGFLIGLDNKEEILKQINTSWAFLVAEENENIAGYTIVEQSREYKDDEYKTWFDNDLKNVYYHEPKMLGIMALAVSPEMKSQGIAGKLLEEIEKLARESEMKYLFTVITIAPVTNCPMIVWRTKAGFKRLAMGKPREEMFGIRWYASLLMYKKI